MKRPLALAALVAATLAISYTLVRTAEPAGGDSRAAALRAPGEARPERAPRGTQATELEPSPTPVIDAGYEPFEMDGELDEIERTPRRTPVEAAPEPETPRIIDLTFQNDGIWRGALLQDSFAEAGSSITVTWGALDASGLVVTGVRTLQEGLNTTEHAPGVPASQGYVKGGLKTGLWTTWHAPTGEQSVGHKESEGHYVYDEQHGTWTEWHASGEKRCEGELLYGDQEGPWIEFHPDGSKRETATYVHGKRDGRVTEWYPGGARKSEVFYSFGRLHLEQREWHANGQEASRGTFEYGQQVGRWRFWDDDGEPDEERSGIYEGGSKVSD